MATTVTTHRARPFLTPLFMTASVICWFSATMLTVRHLRQAANPYEWGSTLLAEFVALVVCLKLTWRYEQAEDRHTAMLGILGWLVVNIALGTALALK